MSVYAPNLPLASQIDHAPLVTGDANQTGQGNTSPTLAFGRFPHAIASDKRIIDGKRLSAGDRLLVPALLSFTYDGDSCTPSDRSLAAYIGASVNAVRKQLDNLERHGHILRVSVPRTAKNATGRIIVLCWIRDPSYLPPPPERKAKSAPTPTTPVVNPSPPQCGTPHHPSGEPLTTPVVTKKNRIESKQDSLKNAGSSDSVSVPRYDQKRTVSPPHHRVPFARELVDYLARPEPFRAPPGPSLAEVYAEAQKRKVESEPAPEAPPPGIEKAGEPALTDGQRQFLAYLTPEQRERFEALPLDPLSSKFRVGLGSERTFRRGILAVFAKRFDRVSADDVARSLTPRAPVAPPVHRETSLAELLGALESGSDPTIPHMAAEAICRRIGDSKKVTFSTFLKLCQRVWQSRGKGLPARILIEPLERCFQERKDREDRCEPALRNFPAYVNASIQTALSDWKRELSLVA